MSIEEIFSHLTAHMRKGLKIHDQLGLVFNFLNLNGYQMMHKYHFLEESENYKKLQDFYLNTFRKLLPYEDEEFKNIIPTNWLKYSKEEVDASTKRTAIRDMMKIWIDWEEEAVNLLKDSYKNLQNQDAHFAAHFIMSFLSETEEELQGARELQLNLESIGYDLSVIVPEQKSLFEFYLNLKDDNS